MSVTPYLYACWIAMAAFLILRHLFLYVHVTRKLLRLPDAVDTRYTDYLEK